MHDTAMFVFPVKIFIGTPEELADERRSLRSLVGMVRSLRGINTMQEEELGEAKKQTRDLDFTLAQVREKCRVRLCVGAVGWALFAVTAWSLWANQ